jgi:hypothetical protein
MPSYYSRSGRETHLEYASFCASAHLFRNASDALKFVVIAHSPNHSGELPSAASASTRFKSAQRARQLAQRWREQVERDALQML